MKKIWFIDEGLDRMGGVERIINTLANALKDKYEIEAISLLKSNDNPYFDYDAKIKINYLYNKSHLISKRYKSIKLIYYFFRLFEKASEYLSIKIKAPLYAKRVKKEDIVIYGRVETALEFLPYIKETRKTIVREAIHLEYHKDKDKIKKYFPTKVNVFIVSSEENINSYKTFFGKDYSKINITKIYNPLTINPIVNYNLESKSIISIGRYDTHKGYDYLIRAFNIVHQKYPDWCLRIVGDGYYKEPMKNLINSLNLTNSVLLVPPTKDVVKELNDAAIYVMASRFEGYANALVEAMSCGVPSISYNWLMGVEEIIKHEENGLVVSLTDRYRYFKTLDIIDADVINLANAIEKLIINKNLRVKFNKNAPKISESRNKDAIIKKWLELIER
jgi:glycosyltransferase involved in cell wall biosynthesis